MGVTQIRNEIKEKQDHLRDLYGGMMLVKNLGAELGLKDPFSWDGLGFLVSGRQRAAVSPPGNRGSVRG